MDYDECAVCEHLEECRNHEHKISPCSEIVVYEFNATLLRYVKKERLSQ